MMRIFDGCTFCAASHTMQMCRLYGFGIAIGEPGCRIGQIDFSKTLFAYTVFVTLSQLIPFLLSFVILSSLSALPSFPLCSSLSLSRSPPYFLPICCYFSLFLLALSFSSDIFFLSSVFRPICIKLLTSNRQNSCYTKRLIKWN